MSLHFRYNIIWKKALINMLWYFLNFTTCQQLCQVLEIMEGICLWSSKTCVIKSMRAKKVWWGGEKNVLKKFKEDLKFFHEMKMKARVEKGFLFTLPKIEAKMHLIGCLPQPIWALLVGSGHRDSCAQAHCCLCPCVRRLPASEAWPLLTSSEDTYHED